MLCEGVAPTAAEKALGRCVTEIFKEFSIEAAHLLPNVPEGHKCRRFHGHSFRIAIHIRGALEAKSGWVMDFADVGEKFLRAAGPSHRTLEPPRLISEIAFFGDFGSGFGIFVTTPPWGRITKVVDNSTEVPNHPGTFFTGFGTIHLADDNTIVFPGHYSFNGLDFQGLYKKSSAGIGVIFDQFDGLVVNGQRISLVDNSEGSSP